MARWTVPLYFAKRDRRDQRRRDRATADTAAKLERQDTRQRAWDQTSERRTRAMVQRIASNASALAVERLRAIMLDPRTPAATRALAASTLLDLGKLPVPDPQAHSDGATDGRRRPRRRN